MTRKAYLRIKASHELPSPTGVALELMRLARDEKTTLSQIAILVETDPAIALRLLRIANSAFSGVRQEVASVHRAVVLLGMRTVTRLALCFSLLSSNRQGRCAGFNYELFWSDSLGRAITARVVSKQLQMISAEESFTCGLLCQIGRLALATAYPEEYSQILQTGADVDAASLAEAESAQFELSHPELAAEMMTDWGLPTGICDAVRNQIHPEGASALPMTPSWNLAHVLQLAGMSSAVLTRTAGYRDAVFEIMLQANRQGIGPEVLHELFDRIRDEWRDLGAVLSLRTREVPSLEELYAEAQRLRQSLGADADSAHSYSVHGGGEGRS